MEKFSYEALTTYRRIARKEYLALAKSSKYTEKKIRTTIGKQLGYVRRDLKYPDESVLQYKELTFMSEKRRNQTFNYIYALAIIMVIDDHTSTRIGILSSLFPYDSFIMPLFVFSSGYFYKSMSIIDNVKHKAKKLLIPYLVWNVIAEILAYGIDFFGGLRWFHMPTVENTFKMFFSESLTTLNGASWFVVMLFWVSVIYNCVRKLLKDNIVHDIILTVVHLIIGFISIYMCVEGYYSKGFVMIFILKILFYIQFYHYGFIFRKYIERHLLNCNKIIICSICIMINAILILIYGDGINFYATSGMGGFRYWYLPIITSITGIVFYYEVMEYLARKIGQNAVIDFISRNTFVILQVHLIFINIPNFYVYGKLINGSTNYLDFDMEGFINSAWIRYSVNARLIGFLCGLLGSLLIAFLLERVKKYLYQKKKG